MGADGGRCPDLGRVHVVSYKGQEPKIFEAVLATGAASTNRPFDAPEVLRILSDCIGAADLPALSAVTVSVGQDGKTASMSVGGRPQRSLPIEGGGARLAKSMIDRTLHDLDARGDTRTNLTHTLWFLWIESYMRSLHNRYDHYRYADEIASDAARDLGRRFCVGFRPIRREGRYFVSEVDDEALGRGGLAAGSEIVGIDGRPIGELSSAEIAHYWLSLRPFSYSVTAGVGGKRVVLAAEAIPRRFTTVTWTPAGDVAYLRISRFAVESIVELRRALRAIERASMRGLVIDLRSNPGGIASPALIDCFLRPGQATMSYRDNLSGKEVDVDATVEYHGQPLAVLVDGQSASMAETFAAAMQVHKRGTIVGSRTFGKGVGQTVHDILDEGTLALVERTYFYPGSRRSWDGVGLTPDVVVELGQDDAARVKALLQSDVPHLDDPSAIDPVLRKAIEILGGHP